MRLFLYEYACAQPASVPLPASVRREGRAMFNAILDDASKLTADIEVLTQDSALRTQHCFAQADYALLIAPEFDGILETLARQALACGCKLLGPTAEAIALTADKWMLYQHWQERGVPTPRTWLPSELPAESLQYIQKHRCGAGSLGVSHWLTGLLVPSDYVVQCLSAGQSVSQSFLITPGGNCQPLLPAYQHMTNDGTFSYLGGSFIQDQQLMDRVTQMCKAAVAGIPGLHGYVGVDAILGPADDGSQDVVLEINPRLTTSYLGLRQATNSNLLACMLQVILEGKQPVIHWPQRTVRWSSTTILDDKIGNF